MNSDGGGGGGGGAAVVKRSGNAAAETMKRPTDESTTDRPTAAESEEDLFLPPTFQSVLKAKLRRWLRRRPTHDAADITSASPPSLDLPSATLAIKTRPALFTFSAARAPRFILLYYTGWSIWSWNRFCQSFCYVPPAGGLLLHC